MEPVHPKAGIRASVALGPEQAATFQVYVDIIYVVSFGKSQQSVRTQGDNEPSTAPSRGDYRSLVLRYRLENRCGEVVKELIAGLRPGSGDTLRRRAVERAHLFGSHHLEPVEVAHGLVDELGLVLRRYAIMLQLWQRSGRPGLR